MGVGKFLKRQMAGVMIALSNVEKNALGQEANDLGESTNQVQRHKQGMLSDALTRGEITQEVKELRWRTYKILEASKGNTVQIVGYDEDDMPITKLMEGPDPKKLLSKVVVDNEDDYEVELVFDNSEVPLASMVGIDVAKDYDDTKERYDLHGYLSGDTATTINTVGEISFSDFESVLKSDRPLKVFRELRPKFEIEKYTSKLIVRNINDKQKLLEFYISKYTDEYDRKSYLLISEIQKAIENPRRCDMLDIQEVGFITNKTIGSPDFREYQYNNITFDKIVDFNGHYVIKFKANVLVNGYNIVEQYIDEDLEERYKNKEAK